jgi:hypothetical protein
MIFPGIELRTPYQLLQALVMGRDMLIQDPIIFEAGGLILPYERLAGIRTLENAGTVSVYWRVGGLPSAGSFHGVLKGCTAANDGTGGSVDLSRFVGDIYIAPTTGSTCRVVAFQAIPKEVQA